MEVELTSRAAQDLEFWKRSGNQKILKRTRELTASALENPYIGIGKPEALKYHLSGKWSGRITEKDRFVYEVKEEILYVLSLKGHYNNL